MALQTEPFDAAKYMRTPGRITAYLNSVLEDGDPDEIGRALETVARARVLHGLPAPEVRADANDLSSFLRAVNGLGLRLQVATA